ncbi:MAG TPA: hypothetical protein VFK04_19045 [Gemmatimonadaceae bacterium]|nr:hypothetical protein [Gemmatimonadaceae bacterium]
MRDTDQRAANRRRIFVHDTAILVALVAVIGGLVAWWAPWKPDYEVPADTDIFTVASGTWAWSTAPADSFCVTRRHTVAFSPDRSIMTITQGEPWTDSAGVVHQVAVYDIMEHSRHHVRGQIRGESRLTANGTPVVWDLVLSSADSYHWHRADWPSFSYTASIQRCPEETPPAVAAGDATEE